MTQSYGKTEVAAKRKAFLPVSEPGFMNQGVVVAVTEQTSGRDEPLQSKYCVFTQISIVVEKVGRGREGAQRVHSGPCVPMDLHMAYLFLLNETEMCFICGWGLQCGTCR